MKIKVGSFIRSLLVTLSASIKRFPEAILTASLATVMLVTLNHLDGGMTNSTAVILLRLTLVLVLGFALSLCLRLFFERRTNMGILQKALWYALAAGSLVAYFVFALPNIQIVTMIRYTAVAVALIFVCPVIPYLFRHDSFERFVICLLTRLVTTAIYTLVLYLGLIAMLFAINTLFSAGISETLYLDLFIISVGIFSPSFFLADIPQYGQEPTGSVYPKTLKVLLLYILIPILAAYTLILYAYFVKILVTRDWPSGMVVNLVLWYAFVSLAVLFLIFPMRRSDAFAKWPVLIFPKAILPLLVMMFVALGIRFRNYGITEDRYFVLVAGIWIFGYMIYLGLSKNPRNIMLPISFSILAMLSVTGPWGAFSISKASQNSRFEKLLEKNNLLRNDLVVKTGAEVPEEDRKEISAIIYYFSEFHSLAELRYVPRYFNLFQTQKVFGFRIFEESKRNYADYSYFTHVLQPQEIYSLEGYEYFVDLTFEKPTDYHAQSGRISVDYSCKTRLLRVFKENQEIYSGNPDGLAVKVATANSGKMELDKAAMSQTDQNNQVKVHYLFKKIQGSVSKKTGKVQFKTLRFYLFIKTH